MRGDSDSIALTTVEAFFLFFSTFINYHLASVQDRAEQSDFDLSAAAVITAVMLNDSIWFLKWIQ